MQELSAASWVEILQSAGVIGALVIFVIGAVKRWWVLGWTYEEANRRYEREVTLADQLRHELAELHAARNVAADATRAELDALRERTEERVLPLLIRALAVLEREAGATSQKQV